MLDTWKTSMSVLYEKKNVKENEVWKQMKQTTDAMKCESYYKLKQLSLKKKKA